MFIFESTFLYRRFYSLIVVFSGSQMKIPKSSGDLSVYLRLIWSISTLPCLVWVQEPLVPEGLMQRKQITILLAMHTFCVLSYTLRESSFRKVGRL